MIRYSHAMTCLMAYHNEKRTEAISIVLQSTFLYLLQTFYHPKQFAILALYIILLLLVFTCKCSKEVGMRFLLFHMCFNKCEEDLTKKIESAKEQPRQETNNKSQLQSDGIYLLNSNVNMRDFWTIVTRTSQPEPSLCF